MDSTNMINGTKPALHKPRSNTSFSHAAVHKADVGDFQAGYFVMADMPPFPQQNRQPKLHKTPERSQQSRKNDHHRPHQQRERSTSTKEIEQLIRESEMHVSQVRLPISPTRSPPRNNTRRNFHSPPQQIQQVTTQMYDQPLSPPKPRKAHHHEKNVARTESFSLETHSGSPMKDKGPSPPPNRWAGPAFSNAPPPSSLPMPEFPPFQPLSSSPPSASLSSTSPSQSLGTTTFAPMEQQLYVPPHPIMPLYSYPAYSVQLSYADIPYAPQHLAQLSTDLRRMLNISQPIPA